MKLKLILSTCVLLLFAIIGGGSVDEDDNLAGWFKGLIAIFIVVFVIALINGIKENQKKEEAAAIKRQKEEADRKAKLEAYNNDYNSFIEKNGNPDKTIVVTPNEVDGAIYVYEAKKSVFLQGKEYKFKDIMSCTYTDNPTTVKGNITAVTKSNNGSVIGRSIVGDVVAGPAGAIIGGTTGKKKTEYIQGADKVYHDYTVIVNLNSISNPILRIKTGMDGKLTNEIVALMNVIIARK